MKWLLLGAGIGTTVAFLMDQVSYTMWYATVLILSIEFLLVVVYEYWSNKRWKN